MLKKGSAYRIHFWYMSKDDVISVMSNSNLIDKKAFYNFFTIKMSEKTYYQRNKRYDTK